jgi:hypothetical protein
MVVATNNQEPATSEMQTMVNMQRGGCAMQ